MAKRGRPTVYKEEYAELARKFCLLGADDNKLAEYFEVNVRTIHAWKKDHPEFSHSIRKGKVIADAEVAESLYNRARGYNHPETKHFNNNGDIISVETTKQYPPDTAAAFIWLKNRSGWKDKKTLENDEDNPIVPIVTLNGPTKED